MLFTKHAQPHHRRVNKAQTAAAAPAENIGPRSLLSPDALVGELDAPAVLDGLELLTVVGWPMVLLAVTELVVLEVDSVEFDKDMIYRPQLANCSILSNQET
jgi:hypothetical protein